MKNSRSFLLLGIISLALCSGCATVISDGGFQPATVSVQTGTLSKEKMKQYIDEVEITDNNNDSKQNVKPGEVFKVKMGKKPLGVTVKESSCIEGTTEQIEARRNAFVFLNVLWGEFSTFSTSTDASNGTNWRYFPADRVITTKVKNTPECQEWLKTVSYTDNYVPMPK